MAQKIAGQGRLKPGEAHKKRRKIDCPCSFCGNAHSRKLHPCVRIERIVPDRQGVEIWVIAFQVLQIANPLFEQIGVGAADITGEMVQVSIRKPAQLIPRLQFLQQMEYRSEQFCKTVVFEQIRVFQQTEHEIAPGNQKTFETVHTAEPALHLHIATIKKTSKLVEVCTAPLGGDLHPHCCSPLRTGLLDK